MDLSSVPILALEPTMLSRAIIIQVAHVCVIPFSTRLLDPLKYHTLLLLSLYLATLTVQSMQLISAFNWTQCCNFIPVDINIPTISTINLHSTVVRVMHELLESECAAARLAYHRLHFGTQALHHDGGLGTVQELVA